MSNCFTFYYCVFIVEYKATIYTFKHIFIATLVHHVFGSFFFKYHLSWIFSQWALFILGIGLMIYLYGIRTYSYFLNRKVPFIKPRAFIGNAGPMLTQTMSIPEYVVWLYNELKGHPYGGIYQFRTPAVLLRDPDLIKTVTVKDFEYFTDHMNRWKDMRAILSPAFTSSKMKTMFVLVDECGKQLVNFLEKCYSGYTPEKPCKIEKEGGKLVVELKDLFTRYTNDVIATSAFGVGVDSLMLDIPLLPKRVKKYFKSLIIDTIATREEKGIIRPDLMLDIPLLPKRVKKYFKSLIIDTIATREEKGIIRPDLVQLLMQAIKEALEDQKNPNSHMRATREEKGIIRPDLVQLLMQAKKEALEDQKNPNSHMRETLRLYPPSVATDRCCVKKYTLPSHPPLEIMPGECVSIPIYAIHRDPEYFPNPDTFDPERFSDENKHNIKPSTFFPFGIGPRICIGSRFALMESKIALVKLLHKFNLKVVPKTPIPIQISKKGFNMTRMEVPHEKPVPFLGNMLGIMWRKESYPEFVVQMYNKFTNHQYSGLYMYKAPYLLIRDPELIKSITIKDFEYFTDHRSILDEASVGLWNKTLVTLKVKTISLTKLLHVAGKRWRDMRATLSPAFTSSKMKTMFVLVSDVCTQVVNHLDDFYKNPSKQDCNITKGKNCHLRSFSSSPDSIHLPLCFLSPLLCWRLMMTSKISFGKKLMQHWRKMTANSQTLRLYPPAAAVDRMCVKPYTLHADPPQEILPDSKTRMPIKIAQNGFSMTAEGGFWLGFVSRSVSNTIKSMDLLLAVQWFLTSSLLVFFVSYILIVICLGLFYYGFTTFIHFSRQDIPHEQPLPFLGLLGLGSILKKSYPEFILDVYNKWKGRQYASMHFFQQAVVVLMDPDIIGAVTTKHFEYFTDRRTTFIGDQGPLLKKGLPHLKEKDVLVIEMKNLFTRFTNDVNASTVFGMQVNSFKEPNNTFYEMGREVTRFDGASRSTLLCYVFYELALHPDIQVRLQEEVDEAMKDKGEEVAYEIVNNMTYLNMVLSETLRLHPPAASIDRVCVKEYFMDVEPEIVLKPKDSILIPIYGLHRDPDHFPNPESFDPERFSDENKNKIKPFTYLPFGLGPRGCLENNMLVLDIKEFFTRYANDVIATTAFGISVNSLKEPRNEFFRMGQEAINLEPWRFFGFMFIPKIMEEIVLLCWKPNRF
ncbi:hypothetical protein C0J52_09647 [Blattella germanica]|nr:hypothetical protein C0J52_09647 [Blattella germanica]